MPENLLYYGDNLPILRAHVADESADLIYLDPPFKSNKDYNVLFKEQDGSRAAAQIKAFEDTWCWDAAAVRDYQEVVEMGGKISQTMQALRLILGGNDMLAYLTRMAPRLTELHRVLKPTGSLYLHCDPTACHYLKMLLDAIFGAKNFRNQIVWKRTHAHSDTKQGRKAYGNVTDVLLYYTAGSEYTFNTQYIPYSKEYIDKYFRYRDPDGRRYWLDNLTGPGGAPKGNPYYEVMGVWRYWRYSKERMTKLIAEGRVVQNKPGNVPQYKRYLDDTPGIPLQNLWADIPPINMMARERLGYATQKPEALLRRILATSSNQGDTVLDPFCGCGTAVSVAQQMGRRWIGIDITHLAITLIRNRLKDAFGEAVARSYEVKCEPTSVFDAANLAQQDRYQFQWWALSLVGACPATPEKKKGKDKGIDGRLYFHDEPEGGKTKQIIFSVKSGTPKVAELRDLVGVITREKAAIGVMILLEDPTKDMRSEAAEAGSYVSPFGGSKVPKIQLLTIEELLDGKNVVLPPHGGTFAFKKAPPVKTAKGRQMHLPLD